MVEGPEVFCHPDLFALVMVAMFAQVVQPLLMLLNDTAEAALGTTSTDATQNATTLAAAAHSRMPTDFSSLMTFIYSISALRDYFKLIVLGGALETLRRIYLASYSSFLDRFFITATFESDDVAFSEQLFPRCLYTHSLTRVQAG